MFGVRGIQGGDPFAHAVSGRPREAEPPVRLVTRPPLADLDDEALLSDLQTSRRAIAAAQARPATLITELALRRVKDAVTELTGRKARAQEALPIAARALDEEVSLELCLSKPTTRTLVDTCVGLGTEAPDTLDALARGDIDWDKATAILHLVQTVVHAQEATNPDLDPDEQVDPEALGKALEDKLLKKAGTVPVASLRRTAAQAMIDVNTRAAEQRHRIRRSHREFWHSPDEDSMCRIGGYLPADAGMRVKNALTRLAHHARAAGGTEDKRTLDQLRIDCLVDAVVTAAENLHPDDEHRNQATKDAGDDASVRDETPSPPENDRPDERPASHTPGASTPQPPASEDKTRRPATTGPGRGRSGGNPHITITIATGTLTGLDDHAGYLHGYGPIVASMARDIAATGTWRCAITDDVHGTLLGLGTSTYTPKYKPTAALRRHLITRDRTCRVAGCTTPAQICDIDHRIPWPDGPTCECWQEPSVWYLTPALGYALNSA